MLEAIVGPRIVAGDRVLSDHAVLVQNGLFLDVVPRRALPSTARVREMGDGLLTPGLVDIHCHGAGGAGFTDGKANAFTRALLRLLEGGVTTVLPTLVSAPLPKLETALETVAKLSGSVDLPRIPGAHLEGPYFSARQSGAQDTSTFRSPDDGSIDGILEHRRSIKMMSLAPELPDAPHLTAQLVDAGIVPAAGHSDCSDEDLYRCQRAGLSHVIHIFSGQSTTTRRGAWRQAGLLEATLASDSLTVEMIADGKHLPPTLMALAYRCLKGRLCAVSDSTPGAGLPEGSRYNLGEREYIVEGGVGMTPDRLSFAGSTTLIGQMIPILIGTLKMGVAEAVAMVTSIPARAAHLDDVGTIQVGMKADMVLFSDQFQVLDVALGGEWVSPSTRSGRTHLNATATQ